MHPYPCLPLPEVAGFGNSSLKHRDGVPGSLLLGGVSVTQSGHVGKSDSKDATSYIRGPSPSPGFPHPLPASAHPMGGGSKERLEYLGPGLEWEPTDFSLAQLQAL